MSDAVKFSLGQTVHFVTDDQKGIVTGILYREHGITYGVTWGSDLTERWHASFELSLEANHCST